MICNKQVPYIQQLIKWRGAGKAMEVARGLNYGRTAQRYWFAWVPGKKLHPCSPFCHW